MDFPKIINAYILIHGVVNAEGKNVLVGTTVPVPHADVALEDIYHALHLEDIFTLEQLEMVSEEQYYQLFQKEE